MTDSAEPGLVFVRFGPGPTQRIPLEWAESMLARWCADSPGPFKKALAEAAVVDAGPSAWSDRAASFDPIRGGPE